MRGTGSRLGRRPLRRPGGMAQGKLRTDPGQQGNLECRGREHARGLPRLSTSFHIAPIVSAAARARNRKGLPPLRTERILAWADAWFAAMGKWPRQNSGPIPGTKETWSAVVAAMRAGHRGLRRGFSLVQLLARRRGARNPKRLPPLTQKQILAWARSFFKTEARWPSNRSGPIVQSPGDTWRTIDDALRKGSRGLPGGSSLAKLLRKHGLK